MFSKFEEILEAWVTKFNPTEEQKKLAERRIKICDECPSRKEAMIGGINLAVYCGECGCPLASKIHTPKRRGACPLGNWDEVDKQPL